MQSSIIFLIIFFLFFSIQFSYSQSNQDTTIREELKIPPMNIQIFYFLLSMVIAIVGVLLILFAGNISLRKLTLPKNTNHSKSQFRDIIRDENYYPSLAIFQFLIWTIIILFVVISIFFIKLFNGIYIFDERTYNIPYNILILMGLSVAIPVANSYISHIKYGSRTETGGPTPKRPAFGSMLAENDKPSLTRFQMFAWTWVSVIFYSISFITYSYYNLHDSTSLQIPDIPGVFVILMGLSQGAYVGGKLVLKQVFEITSVIPKEGTKPFDLTILGSNFGTDNAVTVFLYRNEDDNQPLKIGTVKPETDNRIVITINNIPAGTFMVRIEKDGQCTYFNPSANVKIL